MRIGLAATCKTVRPPFLHTAHTMLPLDTPPRSGVTSCPWCPRKSDMRLGQDGTVSYSLGTVWYSFEWIYALTGKANNSKVRPVRNFCPAGWASANRVSMPTCRSGLWEKSEALARSVPRHLWCGGTVWVQFGTVWVQFGYSFVLIYALTEKANNSKVRPVRNFCPSRWAPGNRLARQSCWSRL